MVQIIDNGKAHTVVVERRQTVAVSREVQRPVQVSSPGPAGPPGAAGEQGPAGPAGQTEGSTFNLTAGETIHGRRVVLAANGQIHHPDIHNVAHATQVVGVALQAGNAGTVLGVRTAGTMTDSGWAWAPGPIYCGEQGVLTQDPGATGWLLAVGRALDATTIDIDIDNPIVRS